MSNQTHKKSPRPAATEQGEKMYSTVKYINQSDICQAKEGDFYSLGDKQFPVSGYLKVKGLGSVPILDVHMMSDAEWQRGALKSRLEHPEYYERSENVQETIEYLRQWLREHNESEEV